MKYGIREICDVVLKAKANGTKVGNATFAKGEPVLYFDSLKTSTMEGAATTVYAQGGRGNARLVAWEGERTVTFTMEDALISELGLAVLTGAGVIDAAKESVNLNVHATERAAVNGGTATANYKGIVNGNEDIYAIVMDANDNVIETRKITGSVLTITGLGADANSVLFDFYTVKSKGTQIEITADKFAGNYYLEASTLFRSQDGVDHPAEFIIPNCKIQSNFTFTMASSGDPSTFTFTMDAFPDYTKFDPTQKVFATIQVIDEEDDSATTKVVIAGPDNMSADSSATMQANAPVKWSVTGTGATINEYTGVLTLDETATGEITVTATAINGTANDTHTISVIAG